MTRTPEEYFRRLYEAHSDPWGFDRRWYERRKYALTVASLPDERFRSGFEPGCSIGALSELLAPRCDQLLAVDQMAEPVARAKDRLRPYSHVRVERRVIPEQWPSGPFDLLLLSEICYYFDAFELEGLLERALRSLLPDAVVVAVHWRGPTDYPLSAVSAHEILAALPAFETVTRHIDQQFLLDVWRFRP